MKRMVRMLIGVLGLGISIAQAQTYINSWENDLEGWSVPNTNFTSAGFSTTAGVMAGTYSWTVQNTTGNFVWDQDGTAPDLEGPSSVGLTTLLASGGSVNVNVTLPNPSDFGWGIGFSLYLNQPGGAGIIPISKWANWLGGVRSAVLTFTIPSSVRSALMANPGLACSLRLATGGGGTGTMHLDGLRVAPLGQLASWESGVEGWSVPNTNFTSVGFSTTAGPTAGLYSWVVQNTTGNYVWDQDGIAPDLESPSSTDLTELMAKATNATVSVYLPASDFGWGIGFSLYLNQPGGAGILPISKWENWSTLGVTNYFTFPVSQAIRTALLNYPTLPCSLRVATGGGGPGTAYFDNFRLGLLPPMPANLWVRELWDGIGAGELIPARTLVTNYSSSAGFTGDPWVANPAELNNCALMAFRPGFNNDPVAGSLTMGLPCTLDGSFGALVQENNGFGFFPNTNQGSFWTAGDFLTKKLTPDGYIDFQAVGEYWFSMTIANDPWDGSSGSLNSQYVTFPSSGWGGLGFADGETTNANFVAIGVSGLDVYYGPTNATYPWGETNASKALYISQGTLGQAGNLNSTAYNPLLDPNPDPPEPAPPYNETYSQTNFTGGPYHINAFGANTVGVLSGDYIVLLGRLRTHGNGTATIDAKYYGTGLSGANAWNTELDMNTNSITWDCSYSFTFGGTMTRLLLFENGQFPFYIFGLRASKNFQDVVGLDPGRINVSPLTSTYVGYPINMTNLAVEANSYSWASPPANYGTLTYQWYKNGAAIGAATERFYNIATASLGDAGTYACVATDPSGTWAPATNSVVIGVTQLNPPRLLSVQTLHNQDTFLLTFDEPSLTGADIIATYSFDNGIVISNVTVVNKPTTTEVQLRTSDLPLGTKISVTVSGVTNVVGGTLAPTNMTFWTDLVQTGAANWNAWVYSYASAATESDYFNNWAPGNPKPYILQSGSATSFNGPTTGITILGPDGYVGDDWGGKLYGWFVPPVTTNYVFYISCDDAGRLSLSTNESPANLRVIACESLWNGPNQWTNICNQYPTGPHRGDGTASGTVGANAEYVWDNSIAGQSPASACLQNRSDQFIVAYYDSTGLPGGPAGATNAWLSSAPPVSTCIPSGMTNFWPNVDANGQALITLQAGQMYYMELENIQIGGGYNECVTYKIAGTPDPQSPTATILSGSVIAGTVPFTPTISIASGAGGPVITYTGVLLSGTDVNGITNVVAQSSASTAISLGGPSQYSPTVTGTMFYRTSN